MRYSLDGINWTEPEILFSSKAKKHRISHTIDLEKLEAKPNDVIIWNAWAQDIDPNGNDRTVSGDVQLIPIRVFDQTVRQQDSKEAGEAQSSTEELINLQRKIINATWNIIREHQQLNPGAAKPKELATLHETLLNEPLPLTQD